MMVKNCYDTVTNHCFFNGKLQKTFDPFFLPNTQSSPNKYFQKLFYLSFFRPIQTYSLNIN